MRYVSTLLVAICSLGTLGCGPKKVAIKPGPALIGVNLSGRWFSPDFGEMKLVHAGQKVTGNYLDPRGPEHNGGSVGTSSVTFSCLHGSSRGTGLQP